MDLSQAKAIWSRLKNYNLNKIRIADNDRILCLDLQHKDIYGDTNLLSLAVELMPPKPNVILLDDKEKIIDALHKYSYADNPQRQILPNLPYQAPKTSFVQSSSEEPIQLPEGCSSVNDHFYQTYLHTQNTPSESDIYQKNISYLQKEKKRLNKKLQAQKQDLVVAAQADYWLACAEAMKPLLHSIKPGQTSLKTTNYLDSQLAEIEISLLPDKNPRENLQIYLKKYHKAKNGLEIIKANLAKTETEIEQIEILQQRIMQGEQLDLSLNSQQSVKQLLSTSNATARLLNLRLGDEYQIVIGRKAKENDFITTQLAKAHDYWFHSQIYHGAHVLLRCFKKQTPTPDLIELCCNLAAGYSKAKNSANVPVDYTQIRYVRKPRKSAPGFVTYTNHHSVYATPIDLRKARDILCEKQN